MVVGETIFGIKSRDPGQFATGIVKKLSFLKRPPTGILRVLTPIELRGVQVDFAIADVQVPVPQSKYLDSGIIMQFILYGNPHKGYRAHELRPIDPLEYNGSVIQSSNSCNSSEGLVICLDYTLDRVVIANDSYVALRLTEPLQPGDRCIVRIPWSRWTASLEQKQSPLWDIVTLFVQDDEEHSITERRSQIDEHLKPTSIEWPSSSKTLEELSPLKKSIQSEATTSGIYNQHCTTEDY